MRKATFTVIASAAIVSTVAVFAQTEIATIPFETIPGGVTLAQGANQPIQLQGDTNVTGEIATDVGVRFPDGTLQVTAGTAGAGVTANQGLYTNTIPDFTPPNAYTEVCFKSGAAESDIHGGGEPTAGGDCLPGDTGWIIERFERDAGAATPWTSARADCLMDGMRLPEPFEWQFSCQNAANFALDSMTDNEEWASNTVTLDTNQTTVGIVAVPTLGNGSCVDGTRGIVAQGSGGQASLRARCVL